MDAGVEVTIDSSPIFNSAGLSFTYITYIKFRIKALLYNILNKSKLKLFTVAKLTLRENFVEIIFTTTIRIDLCSFIIFFSQLAIQKR